MSIVIDGIPIARRRNWRALASSITKSKYALMWIPTRNKNSIRLYPQTNRRWRSTIQPLLALFYDCDATLEQQAEVVQPQSYPPLLSLLHSSPLLSLPWTQSRRRRSYRVRVLCSAAYMVCWSNNNKGTVQWLSWVGGREKLMPGSFGGLYTILRVQFWKILENLRRILETFFFDFDRFVILFW